MIANTSTQPCLPLEDVISDDQPDERVFINRSVWFVDRDGYRVVFCRHEPLYRAALSDQGHLRFIAVSLRLSQLAPQAELARAFGHTAREGKGARWFSPPMV
jgi:hypothetical protein